MNDNPNVKLAFNWVNNADGRWGANLTKTSKVSTAINNIVFSLDCNAIRSNTLSPGVSPTVTLAASDPSPCVGETITLTATAIPPSGRTITGYQWSANTTGGTTSTTTSSPTGNTVYTVTVTDNLNCTATATLSVIISPLPTAVISGDVDICQSETTTLTASGGDTYSWTNGGITSAISVSPATTTTYTVTVTASNGCSDTEQATVTVTAAPAFTLIAIDPTTCTGAGSTGTINISGLTNAVPATSTLSLDGGAFAPYTASLTGLSPGNHSITIRNAANCETTQNITIGNPPAAPTVTLAPFADVCLNTPIFTLSGGTPAGGSYTINGLAATQFDASVVGVGTYVIDYTYTDSGTNCTASASQTIDVIDVPTASISGDNSICAGQSTTLTAGGGTTYAWQGGPSTNTYTVTPAGTTTYTVTVTSNGCSTSTSITVTVTPNPTIPAGAVTVGQQPLCTLSNGSLNLTTPGGITNVFYSVGGTFNAGTSTNVTGQSVINGLDANPYTFRFTDANGCFTDVTVNLTSIPAPPAPVAGANQTTCFTGINNSNPSLTASGGTGYQWYGPNNPATLISGANNAAYQPTVTAVGVYTYYVSNVAAPSCESAKVPITFTINALPAPQIQTSSGQNAFCGGGTLTLSTTAPFSGYDWSDGTTGSTINITAGGLTPLPLRMPMVVRPAITSSLRKIHCQRLSLRHRRQQFV